MEGTPAPRVTTEAALPGDRGIRRAETRSLADFLAFGNEVRAYQQSHPDTLVRVSQTYSPITKVGEITVRWWQRGTEQP